MKKLLILSSCFILFFGCVFMQNCVEADSEIITKDLELDRIDELSLTNSITVNLIQDNKQSIQIEGPANYLDLLNEDVDDGEWDIKFKRCLKDPQKIKLDISLKDISALEIIGSGRIQGGNQFSGDELDLEISGSGDMDLDLNYKSLESQINGSGQMNLRGKVKLQETKINGSGDFMAISLNSNESEVKINGSGDAEVAVSYSLKVKINGSGDVKYAGSPKEMSSEINGSGRLEQVN